MSATFSACLRSSGRVSRLRSLRSYPVVHHSYPGLRLSQSFRPEFQPSRGWNNVEAVRHLSWWPTKAPPKVPEVNDAVPEVEPVAASPVPPAVEPSLQTSTTEAADVVTPVASTPADVSAVVSTPVPEPTIIDQISTSIPPLQYGDLAALDLVHWTPAGFFPWLLEVTQVSTALPWWSVIILTTVGARFAVLPLIIRSMRSAGRLAPLQPQLAEYRAQMANLRANGSTDKIAMQQIMMKQQDVLKKAGVNPFDALLASMSQIVVQFGFFIGLRRMCTLPVEQLKEGGIGYITDLTLADPYFILPAVTTALINVQLSLSSRDLAASSGPAGPHIINGFRALSILGVWFMSAFPVGVNIHILTSVTFMCIQTMVLRIPSVRAKLNLPILPKPAPGSKHPGFRDTWQFIRESIKRKQVEAIAKAEEDRRRRMTMRR